MRGRVSPQPTKDAQYACRQSQNQELYGYISGRIDAEATARAPRNRRELSPGGNQRINLSLDRPPSSTCIWKSRRSSQSGTNLPGTRSHGAERKAPKIRSGGSHLSSLILSAAAARNIRQRGKKRAEQMELARSLKLADSRDRCSAAPGMPNTELIAGSRIAGEAAGGCGGSPSARGAVLIAGAGAP